MGRDDKTIKPPSFGLLAAEGRALLDIPALFAAAPFLATAPRGQPHPVVVLPGLGADDRSTIAIRGFLKSLGYQVYGWGVAVAMFAHPTLTFQQWPHRLRSSGRTLA